MEDTKRKRYMQVLEAFKEPPHYPMKQLMIAICLTQLGDYPDAQHHYRVALEGILRNRDWDRTGEVHWLVDTYVLANQPSLLPRILDELEAYRFGPRGNSLLAFYGYALVHLVSGKDEEVGGYVAGLLGKPKIKWTFSMGKTIEAILDRDQTAFDMALDDLLRSHRGKAKYGELRETPEGFLSLPAMSLSKIALDRGMKINVESEYLSTGYLDYLLRGKSVTVACRPP